MHVQTFVQMFDCIGQRPPYHIDKIQLLQSVLAALYHHELALDFVQAKEMLVALVTCFIFDEEIKEHCICGK